MDPTSDSRATKATARDTRDMNALQERKSNNDKVLPQPLGSPANKAFGPKRSTLLSRVTLIGLPVAFVGLLGYLCLQSPSFASPGAVTEISSKPFQRRNGAGSLPSTAQIISPKDFSVLDTVQPVDVFNGSSFFIPPGSTSESLKAKPFHIYDDAFYDIIGSDPTLTLIADAGSDPLFHEAAVWHKDTDEFWFVQSAGAKAAGTGLQKSAVVQKISLAQAAATQQGERNYTDVTVVNSTIEVTNPNGGTAYRGKIVFAGEGKGSTVPPALYMLDPNEPYNTSIIINNFYGRQFNSLNDVSVNPRNKELYFTDVTYGYLQDFRPEPALPNQVYRFNVDTGVVQVVADGINKPNGITFSPDGKYAYIADTGISLGFWGMNYTKPATIYRWDVHEDGSWEHRKVFAYIHVGNPDGIHTDSQGYVYAGVGDGVHVFNQAGSLIGKIYLGEVSANFNFAGQGRMVICAETRLYYVTLGASGWDPEV